MFNKFLTIRIPNITLEIKYVYITTINSIAVEY